ncbi:hypothetical protein QYE76_006784 [Lolium multiflorum]|uniref:Uncharacterized protein n=1 Tax=Lolium multiflorum TaxID=4521 RepID=A0AAD8RWI5_LOLMU|nr:hypothetical protein QYE76_006784 [Lolium multiflorum]
MAAVDGTGVATLLDASRELVPTRISVPHDLLDHAKSDTLQRVDQVLSGGVATDEVGFEDDFDLVILLLELVGQILVRDWRASAISDVDGDVVDVEACPTGRAMCCCQNPPAGSDGQHRRAGNNLGLRLAEVPPSDSPQSLLMEPNEPINTKFYQLGNGGSLIFEHDLNAVSDFLGRPHPEFHGVQLDDTPGGELQWVITADLRGKMEPPTSERILFSFRESNWLDGLARGLQEALARLCGQNVVRILASRFAHLVRRDAMGVPMELQPHPELRHHAENLDFMLYQTQKDLDATRAYVNQTHAHIIEQGEAIKLLNNDRKSLRQQRAKKDATIDDDGGIDLQGGGAFLSDDDDFEEDEFTEEEDYEFLEAGPDDYSKLLQIYVVEMASPINFNQFLEKEKLKSNGSNFTDWFRHVRIFLSGGNLQYVLDAPLGDPPAETETDEVKAVYETRKTRYSQVQCAILCSLESDLQKRFEHHDPHELMKELKAIFETHADVECYEASKHFFSCMMEEGSSVSEHMLAMTGHAKKLSDLGIVIPNRLGINRVLQSLPPSYKNFVMNYNMQNMNKELPELFGMLKAAEIEIKKEHQVLMVNKTTSFKKQGKSKGKFKKDGKKAATPPMKPKNGPKPDAECYYCKEKGH